MTCLPAGRRVKTVGYNVVIVKKINKIKDEDFQNRHRTEWREFLWNRFLEKLSGIATKKETSKFINSLFSEHEKSTITKRLAVLALIRSGKGPREISRILWMSPATLSALKKNLFNSPNVYRSQRSYKNIKNKITKDSLIKTKSSFLSELFSEIDIWELIKNPPRPLSTGIKGHIR